MRSTLSMLQSSQVRGHYRDFASVAAGAIARKNSRRNHRCVGAPEGLTGPLGSLVTEDQEEVCPLSRRGRCPYPRH